MAKQLSDGRVLELSDLNGQLIPWRLEYRQPQLIDIEGQPFVPIFSDEPALDALMATLGVSDYEIRMIDDGRDFMDSLTEAGVKGCFNVYCIEGGKLRYTEVHMDWQPNAT